MNSLKFSSCSRHTTSEESQSSCHQVHTVGLSSLPSAVKFYRRHGFKLVQRLPDTEDTVTDQFFMQLKTPGKKK